MRKWVRGYALEAGILSGNLVLTVIGAWHFLVGMSALWLLERNRKVTG
jgi:hypothetical protein